MSVNPYAKALGVLAGLILLPACLSLDPNIYRYQCTDDDDCASGFACVSGVCANTASEDVLTDPGGEDTSTALDTSTPDGSDTSPPDTTIDPDTSINPDALEFDGSDPCFDAVLNGDETDIDCGGNVCAPCQQGFACLTSSDCLSNICESNICAPSSDTCSNNTQDGDETDIDCGGSCPGCDLSFMCSNNSDCLSNFCDTGFCGESGGTCSNSTRDGDETDVDCGGSCGGCDIGLACIDHADCSSNYCDTGFCGDSSICTQTDYFWDESSNPLGPNLCSSDCECDGARTCPGGTCSGVARDTCANSTRDGNETDIDCGGSDCGPCPDGFKCVDPVDCISGVCTGSLCESSCVFQGPEETITAGSCSDGIDNDCDGFADCIDPKCIDDDLDGDGIPNDADPDDDGDSVQDVDESCPCTADDQLNTDGDACADACDIDPANSTPAGPLCSP